MKPTVRTSLYYFALMGLGLLSAGTSCRKSSDPQPLVTTSTIPTTLNTFDTYLVGTWDFQTGNMTFKQDGKAAGITKSANYNYSYVLKRDHTFLATIAVNGPLGNNVETVTGKWSTSITAGSLPAGSFAAPPFSASPSGSTKPALPFSFILQPDTGGQEICYIIFFNENDMAFDYLSPTGQSETWEVWRKIN